MNVNRLPFQKDHLKCVSTFATRGVDSILTLGGCQRLLPCGTGNCPAKNDVYEIEAHKGLQTGTGQQRWSISAYQS